MLLVALLFGVTGCRGSSDASSESADPPSTVLSANAVVARVVDGDTIDVRIGAKVERVRLIGIDTPETKKPNTAVQCYGPQATAHTESLLPDGTPVHLERDVVGRDDYGRLLAYVYRSTDGLFVNLQLVSLGYARLLTIAPNVAHVADFADANNTARAARSGLWGKCVG